MDEELEFLTVVGVITGVLPIDGGVKSLEILQGFVGGGGGKFTTGVFGCGDTVGKFGLWTVHSVLGRLEKEGIIN
jgi:hypothetical protein